MTRGPPLTKPRKLYRFSGLGTHIRYGVHNHTLGNVRRGLVERVFMVERDHKLYPTPQPIPEAFRPLVRFRNLLVAATAKTTRLTPEEFLRFYTGRKLERYQRAVESLEMLPIVDSDSWLSTFVKAEKLNITAKPDPAPRVIQPRSPRYNVELGRYLRHAEELLFTGINAVYGGRTVFKGVNADEAGMAMKEIWDGFCEPVAIGMDASRFDQHISPQALSYEHEIWEQLFPLSQRAHLRYLLKLQLKNRGMARCPDGEIRYIVNGCRMSGDMNTSSGNCLIMCASVHNFCTTRRIKKFRLANNGDDCVLFIEKQDLPKVDNLVEYYRTLGFTMKVEPPVFDLERVEFCQTHPIMVGGKYRMIRNCHQSLSKDMHSIQDLSLAVDRDSWLSAVGEGGRVVNEGVPVMQAFFQQFPSAPVRGRINKAYLEAMQYRFHRYHANGCSSICAETRYSFWLAFGLTPDEQIAFEEQLEPLHCTTLLSDSTEQMGLLCFSRA